MQARQTIMIEPANELENEAAYPEHECRRDTCGNDDEPRFFEITMTFYDTVLLENAFETQLANLGDETQVLDLHDDGFENLSNQFLDQCHTKIITDNETNGHERLMFQ